MSKSSIIAALRTQAKREKANFHIPGHRKSDSCHQLTSRLATFDTTELGDIGDLNHLSGAAQIATDMAVTALGAGAVRLLTQGSTSGIKLMIATCCRPKSKLLLARTAHRSVVHALALVGVEPVWLEATDTVAHDAAVQIDAKTVCDQIEKNPEIDAVLLTTPNYYGYGIDLEQIAQACQTHPKRPLLLLDYAHGAHMLAPNISCPHPFAMGADALVTSAHKTLPALTGAALVAFSPELCRRRADLVKRLHRLAPVFQSSSPSWPIAASLDMAREYLVSKASGQIELQRKLQKKYLGNLPPHLKWKSKKGKYDDPLRLCLEVASDAVYVAKLAQHLENKGIQFEMRDLRRIVFIPGLEQPKGDYIRLMKALQSFSSPTQSEKDNLSSVQALEGEMARRFFQPIKPSVSLRHAMFEVEVEYVSLNNAVNRTSADILSVYPPGNAIVIPGEIISERTVQLIQELLRAGLTVSGIERDMPMIAVTMLK